MATKFMNEVEKEVKETEKRLEDVREGKNPEAYKEILSNLRIETVMTLIEKEKQLADDGTHPEAYYKEFLSNLDRETIKNATKVFTNMVGPMYALFQLGLGEALGMPQDGEWHKVSDLLR